MENQGLIHGIKIARLTPSINHLMFANNLVLILRAIQVEAERLKVCLDKYQNWLGQKVNCHKSMIFYSPNTNLIVRRSIFFMLGLHAITSDAKHLGILMFLSEHKIKDIKYLILQVQSRL